MRAKIRYDLFLQSQKSISKINPIRRILYETTYKLIDEMKQSITKPFTKICIHGNYPQLMLPYFPQTETNKNNYWIHSHIWDQKLKDNKNISFLNPEIPFNQIKNEDKYDLIVSCLETHHYQMPNLLQNYMHRLQPDGAVLGCSWIENTLKQLKWAYMMAENQRSGGVSPKVFGFPSLGGLGVHMTAANMKLPTIFVRDLELQTNSIVDILTLIQIFGESGSLVGRRKGAYKDLLLAASAYYDTQFVQNSQQKQKQQKLVNLSLELGLFIGWKQHSSQQKPLSPQKVINTTFFQQLMKQDKDAKMFEINEINQQPTQVDLQQYKQKNNKKET